MHGIWMAHGRLRLCISLGFNTHKLAHWVYGQAFLQFLNVYTGYAFEFTNKGIVY